MKTGIIEIMFEDDVEDSEIQDIINSLYLKNESMINGMEYNQFANKEVLVDIHRTIKSRINELDKVLDKLKKPLKFTSDLKKP